MNSKKQKQTLPETDSAPRHTFKIEFVVKSFSRLKNL